MARGKSGPGGAVCAGYAKAVATFAGTRREWGGAAPFSASRRACQTALEGQTAPQTPFLRDTPKSGAPTLKRLRPAGANSVEYAHLQRLLAPAGQGSVISPTRPSKGRTLSGKKRRSRRICPRANEEAAMPGKERPREQQAGEKGKKKQAALKSRIFHAGASRFAPAGAKHDAAGSIPNSV